MKTEFIDVSDTKKDLVVEIPMYGIGNSLNVAMSLAVVGYQVVSRLPGRGRMLW